MNAQAIYVLTRMLERRNSHALHLFVSHLSLSQQSDSNVQHMTTIQGVACNQTITVCTKSTDTHKHSQTLWPQVWVPHVRSPSAKIILLTHGLVKSRSVQHCYCKYL